MVSNEELIQKECVRISLKVNIPAVNGTGMIGYQYPVQESTEDYINKVFPQENHDEIIKMKNVCNEENMILVYAPSLGTFGKAYEHDIQRSF